MGSSSRSPCAIPDWVKNAVQAMVEQWKPANMPGAEINVVPQALWGELWNKAPVTYTTWSHRPLGVMVLGLAYRGGVPWNESEYANPEFETHPRRGRGHARLGKAAGAHGQARDDHAGGRPGHPAPVERRLHLHGTNGSRASACTPAISCSPRSWGSKPEGRRPLDSGRGHHGGRFAILGFTSPGGCRWLPSENGLTGSAQGKRGNSDQTGRPPESLSRNRWPAPAASPSVI